MVESEEFVDIKIITLEGLPNGHSHFVRNNIYAYHLSSASASTVDVSLVVSFDLRVEADGKRSRLL